MSECNLSRCTRDSYISIDLSRGMTLYILLPILRSINGQ